MRIGHTLLVVSALLACTTVSLASATDEAVSNQIKIVGRAEVTVTGDTVRLEDIADVSSPNIADDESIIALKKLDIAPSPAPGQGIVVQAMSVLDRLHAAQVDLQHIGYTFPRTMTITRAGRVVSAEEVRAAIDGALLKAKREATIKQVIYNDPQQVLPGVATIEAQELFSTVGGQLPFMITVKVPGAADTRFRVSAVVDEYREVPVATRPLLRGSVVGPDDVVMARLSTSYIPKDASLQIGSIVGQALSSNIAFGEVFSRGKLEIPPLITAGSKVTMVVKTALLEATASGIAIESGAEGEDIKVRNEASKKIVIGKVVEAGLVNVTPAGDMQ